MKDGAARFIATHTDALLELAPYAELCTEIGAVGLDVAKACRSQVE